MQGCTLSFLYNGGNVQCRGTLFLPYIMEAILSVGVHSFFSNNNRYRYNSGNSKGSNQITAFSPSVKLP